MNTIASTTNTPAANSTNPLAAGSGSTIGTSTPQLSESDFLTLMAAELKYQDPTQPVNNTQFVAELAQFSSLAAATQQETTLKSILSALQTGGGGNSLLQASQLLGKAVTTAQGQGTVNSATVDSQGNVSLEVQGLGSVGLSDITAIS